MRFENGSVRLTAFRDGMGRLWRLAIKQKNFGRPKFSGPDADTHRIDRNDSAVAGLHQSFHEFPEAVWLKIRSRIAESKDPAKGKQGRGGTTVSAKLMLTFFETCEDCTASVRGPEGDKTRRNMRAAVEKLRQLLQ